VARDNDYEHCSRGGGPQHDCFDGVPLDWGLVPVFLLNDEKIDWFAMELFLAGDHVGFKFGESFVAKT
jgi:hypothetical protein